MSKRLKVCDWIDAVSITPPGAKLRLDSTVQRCSLLGLPSLGPKQKLEIQPRIAENKVGGSVTFSPDTRTRQESARGSSRVRGRPAGGGEEAEEDLEEGKRYVPSPKEGTKNLQR